MSKPVANEERNTLTVNKEGMEVKEIPFRRLAAILGYINNYSQLKRILIRRKIPINYRVLGKVNQKYVEITDYDERGVTLEEFLTNPTKFICINKWLKRRGITDKYLRKYLLRKGLIPYIRFFWRYYVPSDFQLENNIQNEFRGALMLMEAELEHLSSGAVNILVFPNKQFQRIPYHIRNLIYYYYALLLRLVKVGYIYGIWCSSIGRTLPSVVDDVGWEGLSLYIPNERMRKKYLYWLGRGKVEIVIPDKVKKNWPCSGYIF